MKYLIPVLIVIIVILLAVLLSDKCFIPGTCDNKVTISSTTLLTKIQSLSSLTTKRYTYSLTIATESDMPAWLKALYGQKEVLVAVGYVTAGIDMKQAKASNVSGADGNQTLNLLLPAPTLQDCILDEGKTYVAAAEKSIFAQSNPTLDQESRRFAIRQIRQASVEDQILVDAQKQAETTLADFITLLGVPSVQIHFQPIDSNVPLPESCA